MKRQVNPLTREQVLEKMMKWCAYQERSQGDALKKLRELKVSEEKAGGVLAELISGNFLNEERFAVAFAGGRFRMKKWGRIKIKAALKGHAVSEPCIRIAMNSIEPEEYLHTMRELIRKKIRAIGSDDRRKNFHTTLQFMCGKGFESDLVIEELNVILGGDFEA